jgi:sugar (pentulose or hexulose) kinase
MEKMAMTSEPFRYFIDPDDPMFIKPGDMIERIYQFFEKTEQDKPKNISSVYRAVYESLAFKYRYVIEQLEILIGHQLNEIVIVGGGNKSRLLNQFTANLTNRKVIIGPTEATVLGNALVQMYATKSIKSYKTGQKMIMQNFNGQAIEPMYCTAYDDAYKKFLKIINKGEYIR